MNTESVSPVEREHQGRKVKRMRELLGVKLRRKIKEQALNLFLFTKSKIFILFF